MPYELYKGLAFTTIWLENADSQKKMPEALFYTGAFFLTMDEGIIKKNIRLIIYLSLSLTALISIEEATSILQTKLFSDFQNKFVLSLYIKVGQILYRAKQDYFTNNSSTEIINKLSTDINSVSRYTNNR